MKIPALRPRPRDAMLLTAAAGLGGATLVWMAVTGPWDTAQVLLAALMAAGLPAARRSLPHARTASLAAVTVSLFLHLASLGASFSFARFGLFLGAAAILAAALRHRLPIRFAGKVTGEPTPDAPGPLTSMVLLLSTPRGFDEAYLRQVAGEAWGNTYSDSLERSGSHSFLLSGPHGSFRIHQLDAPYWPDAASVATAIPEPLRRQAVLDHQAWIGVDLADPITPGTSQEQAYAPIIRLIVELADPEDTLAVFRPETGQLNVWNDDVFALLVNRGGLANFGRDLNPSVLRVSDDDPLVREAIRVARARWPEFRAAFRHRRPGDLFTVKAPVSEDGRTEFIWIHVQAVTQDIIHGTLANHPVDLDPLRFGSAVSVRASTITDWAYRLGTGEDGPVIGMFTVSAVREAGQRPPGFPFRDAE